MESLAWSQAWHDALYRDEGSFYRQPRGPAAHFTTAAHGPTGEVLARALLRLWARTHGRDPTVVVDLGAGRGELSAHLLAALDDHAEQANRRAITSTVRNSATRVVGVDVVDRPEGLDERVEWLRSPGGAQLPDQLREVTDALVIANEWLDVVPCTIAQTDQHRSLRTVLVDPASGEESVGSRLPKDEEAWCACYWPAVESGARVEVGLARDLAWQRLVGRVTSGLVVALDYGHTRETRPRQGTLTGYRAGGPVVPVPDGSCDITAHVAVDSLGADQVVTQRDVLRSLGFTGRLPPHELAQRDPATYLTALQACSAEAALIDPNRFGGFWWAISQAPRPKAGT